MAIIKNFSAMLGIENITNKRDSYLHGEVREWDEDKQKAFGMYLLHKAYLSYLLDPHPPLKECDAEDSLALDDARIHTIQMKHEEYGCRRCLCNLTDRGQLYHSLLNLMESGQPSEM